MKGIKKVYTDYFFKEIWRDSDKNIQTKNSKDGYGDYCY